MSTIQIKRAVNGGFTVEANGQTSIHQNGDGVLGFLRSFGIRESGPTAHEQSKIIDGLKHECARLGGENRSLESRNGILRGALTIANEDNRKLTLDRDAHAEKLTAAQKTIETIQGRAGFRYTTGLAVKAEAFDALMKRWANGGPQPSSVTEQLGALLVSVEVAHLVAAGRYVRRPETREQRLDVLARQGELIGEMDGMEVVGVTLHSADGSQMPVALATEAAYLGGHYDGPTRGEAAQEAASRVEGSTSTQHSYPAGLASLEQRQDGVALFLPGWELVRKLSPDEMRIGTLEANAKFDR